MHYVLLAILNHPSWFHTLKVCLNWPPLLTCCYTPIQQVSYQNSNNDYRNSLHWLKCCRYENYVISSPCFFIQFVLRSISFIWSTQTHPVLSLHLILCLQPSYETVTLSFLVYSYYRKIRSKQISDPVVNLNVAIVLIPVNSCQFHLQERRLYNAFVGDLLYRRIGTKRCV
jgi:hypothetical protein